MIELQKESFYIYHVFERYGKREPLAVFMADYEAEQFVDDDARELLVLRTEADGFVSDSFGENDD